MATWGNLQTWTWDSLSAFTWGNLSDGFGSSPSTIQTRQRTPLPRPRRGQFFAVVPAPIQATFPTFTDQAGPRPRFAPKPRRGHFAEPPWGQGAVTTAYPALTDQAGPRPRFAARLRRGHWFEPAWPQGRQGSLYPTFTDPPGSRPRCLPKLRRGAFYAPPWPQGTQGQPYPSFTDPAGNRPRWAPKLRRGHLIEPGWPQADQGLAYPSFTEPSGPRPRFAAKLRRGHFIDVPVLPLVPPPPGSVSPERRRIYTARRGHFAEPAWGQATQGVAFPTFLHQSGPRPRLAPKLRRGHFSEAPAITVIPSFAVFIDPPGTRPRWFPRPARGRFASPPWPQGAQGSPYPTFTDQAGSRPRWLPRLRRGHFVEPPWVPPVVVPPPPFLVARHQPARVVRRARFVEPPWTTRVSPPPSTMVSRRRGLPRVQRRKRFDPPWTPVATPGFLITRRAKVASPRRGKIISPPWKQGPQYYWDPTILRGRVSLFRPVRRGHLAEPGWPQGLAPTRQIVLYFGRIDLKWLLGPIPGSNWSFGRFYDKWQIFSDPGSAWALGKPETKWALGGPYVGANPLVGAISAESLEYIRIPVIASVNSVIINPTTDVVKMAFLASSSAPTVGDWQTASWDIAGPNQYQAQCLIGPGGTIALAKGSYYVWVMVTDNPEIVVRQVGTITVTT